MSDPAGPNSSPITAPRDGAGTDAGADWVVPSFASDSDWLFTGVAALPDGGVIVSGGAFIGPARVWYSSDSETWSPSRLPGGRDLFPIVIGAPWGPAVIGASLTSDRVRIWTSPTGERWSRPVVLRLGPKDPAVALPINDVTLAADVLILAGSSGKKKKLRPMLWRWVAGAELESIPLKGTGTRRVATDIALAPSGSLFVITRSPQRRQPRLYRSDGGEWVEVEAPGAGDRGSRSMPTGLASGLEGLVLTTTDGGGGPTTVWTSADGLAWEDVATVDSPAFLGSSGDTLFLVPETIGPGADVLVSAQGGPWCRAELPLADGDLVFGVSIDAEGRTVVVGSSVWIGRPDLGPGCDTPASLSAGETGAGT